MKVKLEILTWNEDEWEISAPGFENVHNNSNLTENGVTYCSFSHYEESSPQLLTFLRRMKYENTDED